MKQYGAAKAGKVKQIVVDEAHLVIERGSGFRTNYAKLRILRHHLSGVSVLATTATITQKSRREVKESLGITPGCKEFVLGTNRMNLLLEMRNKYTDVLTHVSNFIKSNECPDGKSIVCFNYKNLEVVKGSISCSNLNMTI